MSIDWRRWLQGFAKGRHRSGVSHCVAAALVIVILVGLPLPCLPQDLCSRYETWR
jgi:hypothetical protein